jgi:hypothetical protein
MALASPFGDNFEHRRKALAALVREGSYLLAIDETTGGWRFYRARNNVQPFRSCVDVDSPWGSDEMPIDETLQSQTVWPPNPAEDQGQWNDDTSKQDWSLDLYHIEAVFNDRADVDHAIQQLTDAEAAFAAAIKPHQERFAVMVKLLSNVLA